MKSLGLLLYGEMGYPTLESLLGDFKIVWAVLPKISDQTETERKTFDLAQIKNIPIKFAVSNSALEKIVKKETPDAVVVASYDKVIPKSILESCKFINVHLGDLPRYRGRATVNWAIINGLKKIPVAIHEVVEELDSGNVFAKLDVAIGELDDVGVVYERIGKRIKQSLSMVIKKVLDGYSGVAQKGEATYCCTRTNEDGLIDWSKSSSDIHRLIRAVTRPYPGAFTYLEGKKMIIWDAEIVRDRGYVGRIPGRIGRIIHGIGVEILTGDSSIIIKNIRLNNREMNASDIIRSTKKTLGINIAELDARLNH